MFKSYSHISKGSTRCNIVERKALKFAYYLCKQPISEGERNAICCSFPFFGQDFQTVSQSENAYSSPSYVKPISSVCVDGDGLRQIKQVASLENEWKPTTLLPAYLDSLQLVIAERLFIRKALRN